MNCFTALSYSISYIFQILFIYLFIIHRYSKMVTGVIYFFLFLLLNILDFFKTAPVSRQRSLLCYRNISADSFNSGNTLPYLREKKQTGPVYGAFCIKLCHCGSHLCGNYQNIYIQYGSCPDGKFPYTSCHFDIPIPDDQGNVPEIPKR